MEEDSLPPEIAEDDIDENDIVPIEEDEDLVEDLSVEDPSDEDLDESEEDSTESSDDDDDEELTDKELEDARNTVQRFLDVNEGFSLEKTLQWHMGGDTRTPRKKRAIRRVIEDMMDEEETPAEETPAEGTPAEETPEPSARAFSEKEIEDGQSLIAMYRDSKKYTDQAMLNTIRTESSEYYDVVKHILDNEGPTAQELHDIEKSFEEKSFEDVKKDVLANGIVLNISDNKVGYEKPNPKLQIVPDKE